MSEHGPGHFQHRRDKLRIFSSPLVRRTSTGGSDESEDSTRHPIEHSHTEFKGGYAHDDENLPRFKRVSLAYSRTRTRHPTDIPTVRGADASGNLL